MREISAPRKLGCDAEHAPRKRSRLPSASITSACIPRSFKQCAVCISMYEREREREERTASSAWYRSTHNGHTIVGVGGAYRG